MRWRSGTRATCGRVSRWSGTVFFRREFAGAAKYCSSTSLELPNKPRYMLCYLSLTTSICFSGRNSFDLVLQKKKKSSPQGCGISRPATVALPPGEKPSMMPHSRPDVPTSTCSWHRAANRFVHMDGKWNRVTRACGAKAVSSLPSVFRTM